MANLLRATIYEVNPVHGQRRGMATIYEVGKAKKQPMATIYEATWLRFMKLENKII